MRQELQCLLGLERLACLLIAIDRDREHRHEQRLVGLALTIVIIGYHGRREDSVDPVFDLEALLEPCPDPIEKRYDVEVLETPFRLSRRHVPPPQPLDIGIASQLVVET